jgi:spermidine synthase
MSHFCCREPRLKRALLIFASIVFPCRLAGAQVDPTPFVSTAELFLATICVIIVGVAANAYLVGLVRRDTKSSGWERKWEFSPIRLGGFTWWNLASWSLLSLFMEMLMIRWISSEIRIFAYFKNFVLIACFMGFGLGCYLSRRKVNLLLMLIPMTLLTLLIQLPWVGLRVMIARLPGYVAASAGTQVWDVPSAISLAPLALATALIVPIFGLIAFFFIPFGQLVGWYLENARDGILAYSINVFAGLAGIIAYTVLCFLSQPPRTWFLVSGVLLVALLWRIPLLRWSSLITLIGCAGLLSVPAPKNVRIYWSPYQKLTLGTWGTEQQVFGYYLNTNDSWYQQILDLSPKFVQSHAQLFQSVPVEWNAYNVPYHFYHQPSSVLILGAGMGNDVAAALRNGAAQVTAVEIDPLILKLGREFHFEKPYSSPRVRQVNDDARSYVENTRERFDLIVFSLLDSHTTSSYYTNIRIDNYVYTVEALEAAKRLLKSDGLFIVKFQVQTPWVAGRLYGLLSQVFGRSPVELESEPSIYTSGASGGSFFITGSQERIDQVLSSDHSLAKYLGQHHDVQKESATLTTDDWPYFYQRSRGLPLAVVLISVALVLLCVTLLRDSGGAEKDDIRWHFFFLGAGFLLLEAQIVSKIALLFGTTWLVNSIVVGGLLLLILAANTLVKFIPSFSEATAYAALFVTLMIGFFVPLRAIFFASLWARVLAALLVLCLPVFFAGIIFIRSFSRESFSSAALGSNLLGAIVGGLLESASLWTGIRWLLLFAAALYLASWIALKTAKSSRDGLASYAEVTAGAEH